jgi:hypothetical protein
MGERREVEDEAEAQGDQCRVGLGCAYEINRCQSRVNKGFWVLKGGFELIWGNVNKYCFQKISWCQSRIYKGIGFL